MKTNIIALCLALAGGTALAADSLETRQLLEGKVTMLVPASFTNLSEAARKAKYPGANGPAVVLTDESTTVNLALDHKTMPLKPEELKLIEPAMRQQLSGAKIKSSGLRMLDGHEFLVIEVDTEAVDGLMRNVMAMTSFEGTFLVISYNCKLSVDESCGTLGVKLIESIKLRAPAGS